MIKEARPSQQGQHPSEDGGPHMKHQSLICPCIYVLTNRMWDSLLVMKSGCAGGRGFAPRPGQS